MRASSRHARSRNSLVCSSRTRRATSTPTCGSITWRSPRAACRTIAASPPGAAAPVFNGKAVVHEGAQQSQARQASRNLLLTPGAEIDTKPELEIYADDVQCSHGATTGQLDAAALFYLRSRGLSATEARSALTRAFSGAVLSRIDHAAFCRNRPRPPGRAPRAPAGAQP